MHRYIIFIIVVFLVLLIPQKAQAEGFVPDNLVVNCFGGNNKIVSKSSEFIGEIDSQSEIADWSLFIDPYSKSSQFFGHSTGIWLNDNEDDLKIVQRTLDLADDDVPVFVVYFSPTKYSYNPPSNEIEEYLRQNARIADLIGNKKAIIILEPDLLCLSADNTELLAMNKEILREVVKIYKITALQTRVYVDAGHSNWHSVDKMVRILKDSGIDQADGFVTNVSNYQLTENEIRYAQRLAKRFVGKRFVIDTSRNGNGPGQSRNGAPYWSDPVGITTGHTPTFITNYENLDAYLWVKPPGEADGSVDIAGSWHPELLNLKLSLND